MAVWYKDSKGIDHYGTPSTSAEKSSVKTSTQPTGSLSSGNKNTSSGSSVSSGSSSSSHAGSSNTQSGGAYVSSNPYATDEERTREAIASYQKLGQTAQEEAAKAWAQQQGYDISNLVSSPSPGKSLVDWGRENNVTVSYDPKTNKTIVNGKVFDPTNVPGATVNNGYNYVTDPDALLRAAEVNTEMNYTPGLKKEEELKKEEVKPPYQNIWGDFLKEMQQYVPKPTTAATPDLSVYTQTIQNSLAPILETQLANLNAQRLKAKKDTENDLIRRGFFGQLPSAEKMNELNSIFDNTEANLRANYLSTVMDKAFPLYSQSLAQDAQSKQSYNQNMLNLGLAVMNGMVDQQKFIADDAYRKAVLARLYGQDAASMFGTVGGVQ